MSNDTKRGHNAASKPGEVGFQPVTLDEPTRTEIVEQFAPTLGVNGAFIARLTEHFPDADTMNVTAIIDENTEQFTFSINVFDADGLELTPQAEYDYDTGEWDTTNTDEFDDWVNNSLFTESDAEAFAAEHMIRSTYVEGFGYQIEINGVPIDGTPDDRPDCNGMCLNGADMGGPEHTNMVYPHPDCSKHTYGDRLDAYDPQYIGQYKNNDAKAWDWPNDWADDAGEPPF
ncbi:hypothetical protein [Aeromicrobium sp. 179-A 4D2 NHS]|uniref:hypothetical protein n=1 Tax=Aeromicrobium sp. 179-A 4D2 NHS TaxID=3142375 RepID=UPI0039A21818